jgi:hypothetical protein
MIRLLAIVFSGAALAAFAAWPPLENFCVPFNSTNCVIIWNAPTNQLPRQAKIWKVVPAQYSPTTISNLLEMAELRSSQKKRVERTGVLGSTDAAFFGNRDETRNLSIIPAQGKIVIGKIGGVVAQIPKEKPNEVPDPQTAFRLTLDLLQKIGIDQSRLLTNSNGKVYAGYGQAEVIGKDKATGRIVTNVVEREIHFPRQIDGIPVQGPVGVFAKFGNEGKLASLEITMRAITPDRICSIPDVADFVERIKSGRTFIPNGSPFQTGKNAIFQRLTISEVSLYYWEDSGSEPQTYIYPFAVLDAQTDQQGDNANVQLFVPITDP